MRGGAVAECFTLLRPEAEHAEHRDVEQGCLLWIWCALWVDPELLKDENLCCVLCLLRGFMLPCIVPAHTGAEAWAQFLIGEVVKDRWVLMDVELHVQYVLFWGKGLVEGGEGEFEGARPQEQGCYG